MSIHGEYCTIRVYRISRRARRDNRPWLLIPTEDIALCMNYPAYSSSNKQSSEQYVYDEESDNPKPGAYAWIAHVDEQWYGALHAHYFAGYRSHFRLLVLFEGFLPGRQ